eukprot:4454892-Pleurochrysis_carterae.AAC.1
MNKDKSRLADAAAADIPISQVGNIVSVLSSEECLEANGAAFWLAKVKSMRQLTQPKACAMQNGRSCCECPEKETNYVNRGAILVYNVKLTSGGSRLTAVSRMQIMEALYAQSELALSRLLTAWKDSF